jgi:DNA invertase Pin-like site-specific DNA recombinase
MVRTIKRKIRKCAYARVSTLAEEQEHSLSFQTHYYKTLIESERDSEFVGIYADTRSGKTSRLRKQFNAMLKAVRRGEIDYIYTKSIARFARNLLETLKIIRELREIGVGIFFEKEGIDTLDYKSDFMISIYSTVAEHELVDMGNQVKWAARRRYADGSVEVAHIYGYEVKDKTLIPNEAEAAVVREIYERYANGEGHDKIARALNERGLKRKFSSELWTSGNIKIILENEKYVGDALLQKTYYDENGRTVKNYGEVKQYYVENNHEAIVTRELYDRVQARREQRQAAVVQKKQTLSPFSGKIVCGECGKGYAHRKNNRNTPYEKWIWCCQTYIQHGRQYCGGHNIREKDFIPLFLSAYNEAAGFKPHEVKNLDEAIKDLLSQERELIALKTKGYMTREAYDEQHGELLRQIQDTEDELARQSRNTVKIEERAEEYSNRLAAALEVAEVDGFTITFKFKNGAEVKRNFNNDTDRTATWNKKRAVNSLANCKGEDSASDTARQRGEQLGRAL